jgi:hypothetical protein
MAYKTGDKVKIDIPDQTDPDYDSFHGSIGEVVEVIHDDAGQYTGDWRDSALYRVEFEGEQKADFRWRDIRPA